MAKLVRIRIQTDTDVMEFAEAHYKGLGYFSPVDFLNAIFNMAVIREADWMDCLEMLTEDSDYPFDGDLGDDIPF